MKEQLEKIYECATQDLAKASSINDIEEIRGKYLSRKGEFNEIKKNLKNLSDEDKKEALALSKILFNIKACYDKGITDVKALTETAYSFLNEHHALEYLEFRDKENLEEKTVADDNTQVFIALKIGDVRLIDNILLG